MKNLLLTITITFLGLSAIAQITTEDLAVIQSHFQKSKQELVSQNLTLNQTQGMVFWPIYEEYEGKRKQISTERAAIINDYLLQYDALTDQQAEALTNRVFANDISLINLQKSYYKKIAKAIGGKNTSKFYQLENYLQQIVRQDVQDNIPFIDELSK